jgi:hypothetical protein
MWQLAHPSPTQLRLTALLLLLSSQAAAAHEYAELEGCTPVPSLEGAVRRFSSLLTFATVANASLAHHQDRDVWATMDTWLRETYADVFVSLHVEMVSVTR